MKRLLLTMAIVSVLLLASCSPKTKKMQEEMQETKKEEMTSHMEKDDMKDDDMMDKDDMKDDDMTTEDNMKDDDMTTEDNMKDDDMTTEDNMKNDDMMDKDDMKDDNMMDKDNMKDDDMMTEELMNEGEMASDFTLKSINGEGISLSSLKGEKVYLKFWASWCPVCLNGLEELNELSKSEENFKIYSIIAPSLGGEKSVEDFKTWFASLGYENIEVLLDEDGEVFRNYGIRALPTSVYISSDGVKVFTAPGHQANKAVISMFEEIK